MTIKELQQKLLEAYSVKNLNNISLTLINLYKEQQYSTLQKIAGLISDSVTVEINNDGKGFSKLMMLYHPDRAGFHINEINNLAHSGDFDKLLDYSHILKLERIEEIAKSFDSFEDIDYSPVYDWDFDIQGFSMVNDLKEDDEEEEHREIRYTNPDGFSFYDAVKIRNYGHTSIEFPSYYLEDYEEFELSGSDINDLDGIQFCIHAKNIDLSDNLISDLSLLSGLSHIESLNLADNKLSYIDALSNLKQLKSLILANNTINDLSPLFHLENLEYLNIAGNPVSENQIKSLYNSGVLVDY